nr:MAG TPA: hypothetical protein [Caudoviricetes sp.]
MILLCTTICFSNLLFFKKSCNLVTNSIYNR